jgi:hypothetical protein
VKKKPTIKGKPTKSTASNELKDENKKKQISIAGISTGDDGGYIFKILIDNSVKWVKRSFLVPDYLNELC